jgi:hypothetical protein
MEALFDGSLREVRERSPEELRWAGWRLPTLAVGSGGAVTPCSPAPACGSCGSCGSCDRCDSVRLAAAVTEQPVG